MRDSFKEDLYVKVPAFKLQDLIYLLRFSPTLLYLNVFGLLREPALEELKERLQGGNHEFIKVDIFIKMCFRD